MRLPFIARLIILAGCVGCTGSGSGSSATIPSSSTGASPDVPELARWEAQMKSFGEATCRTLLDPGVPFDPLLAATYYDAEWVFYQIADYTGEERWLECADAAERVYRDRYVLPNDGGVPGYWNFSRGLREDYERTGDERSREAVRLLAQNAAYAREAPLAETAATELSREVAYAILAYLNAEAVGEPPNPRLALLVDQALGHIEQWTIRERAPYVRPFMVGLTMHALIEYFHRSGDPRVVPAVGVAADWIWERTWDGVAQAFRYTDRVVESGGTEAAPDLNLLIAPAFAWLYRQTGEQRFAERGDQVFAGGVRSAYLANGKQFNQNYRWSFDFVRWRTERAG